MSLSATEKTESERINKSVSEKRGKFSSSNDNASLTFNLKISNNEHLAKLFYKQTMCPASF